MVSWFSTADNVTATLVASALLAGFLRAAFRRTAGRRHDITGRLNSITCGLPAEKVAEVFGVHIYADEFTAAAQPYLLEPCRIERRVYDVTYGLLTVHLIDGVVAAYALTRTDRNFTFDLTVISAGRYRGRLGKMTYAEADSGKPISGVSFVGANIMGYTELHYYGNPGFYNHYALSSTMTGVDGVPSLADLGDLEWGRYVPGEGDLEAKSGPLEEYRQAEKPNTIAVFGQDFDPHWYTYGDASGTVGHVRIRQYVHQKHLASITWLRFLRRR